jgi:uncharacterized membrane protein YwaF
MLAPGHFSFVFSLVTLVSYSIEIGWIPKQLGADYGMYSKESPNTRDLLRRELSNKWVLYVGNLDADFICRESHDMWALYFRESRNMLAFYALYTCGVSGCAQDLKICGPYI